MNLILCLLLCFQAAQQPAVNSALLTQKETLQKVWTLGYQAAGDEKLSYQELKTAKHGIGKINGETVSWVTFLHPRLLAFEKGFTARRKNADETEQAASRAALSNVVQENQKQIRFEVELGIAPAFNDSSPIHRQADPNDLKGVHVELRVGKRSYPPVQQPENIKVKILHGTHFYVLSLPDVHDVPQVYDRNSGEISELPPVRESYIRGDTIQENYIKFQGIFDAVFDLYDSDGRPRITDKDRDVMVIVTGKFGRQQTAFRLRDWLTAYEK